jgi:hypothetical protein
MLLLHIRRDDATFLGEYEGGSRDEYLESNRSDRDGDIKEDDLLPLG